MAETDVKATADKPKVNVGPGGRLKSAREKRGIGVNDLASTLRLDSKVITGIEADDYDNLPAAIFTRGYIRNYALALQMDPEPLCKAYDAVAKPPEPRVASEYQEPKKRGKWLWLILILAAAGAGLYYWFNQPQPVAIDTNAVLPQTASTSNELIPVGEDTIALSAIDLATNEPEEPASITTPTADTVRENVAAALTSDVELSQPETQPEPPVEGVSNTVEPEQQQPQPEPQAEQQPEIPPAVITSEQVSNQVSAPDAPISIFLEVSDSCWTKITDGTGDVRVDRTLRAGNVRDIDVIPPVSFVLGNAAAATLKVNGVPYDVQAHRKASGIARFTVAP